MVRRRNLECFAKRCDSIHRQERKCIGQLEFDF
jgi:hypothetical protein